MFSSGGTQGKLSMQVVKSEGLRSLYLGLTPALMRSVLYGGLRLGLYQPSKYVCELAFESPNVLMKIASGAFSGAVATALTNPVEVLKVLDVLVFIVLYKIPTALFSSLGTFADEIKNHKRANSGAAENCFKRRSDSPLEGGWTCNDQSCCVDRITACNL